MAVRDWARVKAGIFHDFHNAWVLHLMPENKPLTLAAYCASEVPDAYVAHLAVHDELPAMPLFLTAGSYVDLPLAAAYEAAWRGVPAYWRGVPAYWRDVLNAV